MISLKSLPHLCSWPLDLLIHLFMPEISLQWCSLMSFARDWVAERQRNKDKRLRRFVTQNCVFKKKDKQRKMWTLKTYYSCTIDLLQEPSIYWILYGYLIIWQLMGQWENTDPQEKIFAVNVMTCLVYNMILSRWLFFKFQKWKNMP